VRLFGLTLDQNDQVSQVARRLGQTALTEPRMNATFQMPDGCADVVSGQLNLVASRARACHVMTVRAQ
jgi:hypothetical protein